MAYARSIFNTQTLTILNSVDPGETLNYDWSIDEDYSIVLLEGLIAVSGTILDGVSEHRIQPNEQLSVIGAGTKRSYFISLFRIDNESVADQIVSSANKNRMQTFTPDWYDSCIPENPDPIATWKSEFQNVGNYTLTKSILDTQIANSDWN